MKKVTTVILAMICLLGCLVGCGAETTQPTTTVQAEKDYTPYMSPWDMDVVAQAKADGKLHYYFMAAEELFEGKWGDCCLLVFPDGTTLLMDSGVKGYGPVLLKNLQKMGVTKLDYIVITHPHSDHQNGVFHPDNIGTGVLGNLPVGKVYFSKIVTTSREDHSYVEDACKAKNIPYEILELGSSVQLTDDVIMEVLWPIAGTKDLVFTTPQYNLEINQNSMVVRFDFGEHRALFSGDLHSVGEMLCLVKNGKEKLDADLLKVPHHGHDTSSSRDFLNAVSPKLAVATGRVEIVDAVLNNYKEQNAELLCDLDYGYIHVSADSAGEMTYETSRNKTQDEPVSVPATPGVNG